VPSVASRQLAHVRSPLRVWVRASQEYWPSRGQLAAKLWRSVAMLDKTASNHGREDVSVSAKSCPRFEPTDPVVPGTRRAAHAPQKILRGRPGDSEGLADVVRTPSTSAPRQGQKGQQVRLGQFSTNHRRSARPEWNCTIKPCRGLGLYGTGPCNPVWDPARFGSPKSLSLQDQWIPLGSTRNFP
jgi:hypothetical protein